MSDNMTWVSRAVLKLFRNEILPTFSLGKTWNQLLYVLRQPESSAFPSKRYPQLFYFLATPHGCGEQAYTFGLDSTVLLADVLLAPNKLISFWVGLIIYGMVKAPFGKAVSFAAGCSLGLLASGIIGSIFLGGGCQSDDR